MSDPDKYVVLGFCTDKSDRISTLIRWLTWCEFSHVVLVAPFGHQIIEATHGEGVVFGSAEDFMERDGACVRRIAHPDPHGVWTRAVSQIGKPYDWRYAWGWLFRRDWQDAAAWACSELIAWAGGFFERHFADSITPRDLYLISTPLERTAP